MIPQRSSPLRLVRCGLLALAVVAVTAPAAHADTARCQRAIAKASALFFQAVTRANEQCQSAILASGGGTCPDAKTTAVVAKAKSKLAGMLDQSCGGSDEICNADAVDEDLPAAIGWPSACPNVATERCDRPIESCADIASCLECLGTEITTSTTTLAYGAFVLPSVTDRTLNKCQRAIGKANAGYTAAVDRALAKACGGADRALGGGDDLTPVAIGFAELCPNATAPGGPACGGAVTDLTSLVGCLDCVTDAALACADRAAVPQLTPYPPECTGCLAPPRTTACPTTISLTALGDRVDLDLGTQTASVVSDGIFNNAFDVIHGLPGLSRIRMPVELSE